MPERNREGPDAPRPTGTGAPPGPMRRVLRRGAAPQSPDAVRQLEDAFGPARRRRGRDAVRVDYDDVVQQSFPASDPPPPPG